MAFLRRTLLTIGICGVNVAYLRMSACPRPLRVLCSGSPTASTCSRRVRSLLQVMAMRLSAKLLWTLVGSVAVYGRLNVNVALNRPTFMVSTHNDPIYGGDFPSSRAVDGNNDTIAMKVDNSCAVTTAENDPWWAVDLGVALAVAGVLFSNRAETLGKLSTGSVTWRAEVSQRGWSAGKNFRPCSSLQFLIYVQRAIAQLSFPMSNYAQKLSGEQWGPCLR